MNITLVTIFTLSFFLLLHSYLLYPVTIFLLNFITTKKIKSSTSNDLKVSILISVFNEEKVIEKTVRMLFSNGYPDDRLEIIIGSDKSEDGTNEILDKLSNDFKNLTVKNFDIRRGKAQVLNDLYKIADGDILVFCDANTIYEYGAITKMVSYYTSEKIGGVSGKLRLLDFEKSKESGSQETRYWDFETWLKEKEGSLGILIGANGGIYSMRKNMFVEIPIDHPVSDDLYLSLKVLEQKKDFLFIKDAIGEELTAPSIEAEFYRKIRTTSNNLYTIKAVKKLLNPFYGLSSYGFWSHKVVRWFSPILMLFLLLTNILLYNVSNFFEIFLYFQLTGYGLALIGFILTKLKMNMQPFLLFYYFVMTNIAMLIGIVKYLQGQQTNLWHSTPR
ncbi:MAG: glycosyltransferase [Ignavibacteriales bacterium]|nr:MAG: glycosyltransferase [Ignavibacteriales bacterium]